jgi:hypothetical protein
MGVIWYILGVCLILAGYPGLAAAAPKVGADGKSLVLESGNSPRKDAASGDTLYELLGKEVQVFIFNSKTRVWPRVYYRSGQAAWSSRCDPRVEGLIYKYARIYGVDPSLVRAVMRHESGFNAGAVSPKGAQGLMQLMPGTAELMGVRNPFDPEQNIAGGVGYLRRCLDRFGHNVPLAVAAYNAGPERVAQFGTVPPIPETQLFVHNVLGTYTGPSQVRPAPPGSGKNARGSLRSRRGVKEARTEKAAPTRRRPKAKIIEVRTYKSKARPSVTD